MTDKLRVGILFGGKSGEHDVSLLSATSVMESMDLDRYEVIPIGIDRNGEWQIGEASLQMLTGVMKEDTHQQIASNLPSLIKDQKQMSTFFHQKTIDVVFPVLHGTYGEDGTIQGFLEIANIPYVGAGVLASAVGMDKVITKKLFAQAGLPQAKYVYFRRSEFLQHEEDVIKRIEEELGYPCFVKPANLGSSVGISKASDRDELRQAIQLAAKYDVKIVVEEFVSAREIEVAVLGNHQPQASVPGEIISSNDFYDYHAKYLDGKSKLQIPAKLSESTIQKIQKMAVEAFQAIDGSGLSRVDFFVCPEDERILINEINTMPGFTAFSMYAKLWEYSGLSYPDLVNRLINFALERHQEKESLVTTLELE